MFYKLIMTIKNLFKNQKTSFVLFIFSIINSQQVFPGSNFTFPNSEQASQNGNDSFNQDDAISFEFNFSSLNNFSTFPFFGENKTKFHISSNGLLTFSLPENVPLGGRQNLWNNSDYMPCNDNPEDLCQSWNDQNEKIDIFVNDVIAPYWQNLYNDDLNDIKYYEFESNDSLALIIQWSYAYPYGEAQYTFVIQTILWANGDIQFQYNDGIGTTIPISDIQSATIGIENAFGTEAVIYSYGDDQSSLFRLINTSDAIYFSAINNVYEIDLNYPKWNLSLLSCDEFCDVDCDEYCYSNDGDNCGDERAKSFYCPDSVPPGWVIDCSDSDDTNPNDCANDENDECNYTVILGDTSWDGWTGNILTIGDSTYTTNETYSEFCYPGPLDVDIMFGNGEYEYECFWSIVDIDGNELINMPAQQDGGDFNSGYYNSIEYQCILNYNVDYEDDDQDGLCNELEDEILLGCTDVSACNFNEEANEDDNSCNIPTSCDLCNEDGSINYNGALDGICEMCVNGEILNNDDDYDSICNDTDDCFGDLDVCGICNGDGIQEGECDCDGNIEDCNGDCGGNAIIDECGICNGDGIQEGECDCDGNIEDCNGDCGGNAIIDECGICNGNSNPFYCDGEINTDIICNDENAINYNEIGACDLDSTSVLINANNGGFIAITSDDPSKIIGVFIPPGTLTNDVVISIHTGNINSDLDLKYKASFLPHGLLFDSSNPIQITMPYDENNNNLTFLKLDDDNDNSWNIPDNSSCQELPCGEFTDGVGILEVSSFSSYGIGCYLNQTFGYIDTCNNCVGGTTENLENYNMDCLGICFGNALTDINGICCDINSGSELDECEICNGDGTTCLPNSLYQNYPNPFNNETNIYFTINTSTTVSLSIYDILGTKIKNLVNEYKNAGAYEVIWDGTDQNNNLVNSDIYIYHLKTENFSEIKRMVFYND